MCTSDFFLHQPGVVNPNVSCFVLCFRYGGWDFGKPLPIDLKMDMLDVPANRTLSKVIWMSDIALPQWQSGSLSQRSSLCRH